MISQIPYPVLTSFKEFSTLYYKILLIKNPNIFTFNKIKFNKKLKKCNPVGLCFVIFYTIFFVKFNKNKYTTKVEFCYFC